MNDIIQEIAEIITMEFGNQIDLLTAGGHDISSSIIGFGEALGRVGGILVGKAMEALNQALVDSEERKRYWVVKNKTDNKTLCTKFGKRSMLEHVFRTRLLVSAAIWPMRWRGLLRMTVWILP